jgi:uncharacterized damage-inducible protein DinB
MFEHLAWADERTQASLERAGTESIARSLEVWAHALAAEHVWLARLHGRPPFMAIWPELSLKDCAAVAAENRSGWMKYLEDVTDEDLDRPIAYRNSAGLPFTSRLDDILTHVALHGSYHRGQIARILREEDDTPATTDYIAFVRGAPAATRDEAGGDA